MAILSPYLSIITLNVNGLNSPMRRHGIVEWKKQKQKQKNKTIPPYMLPITESCQLSGHKQTGSEGIDGDVLCKW